MAKYYDVFNTKYIPFRDLKSEDPKNIIKVAEVPVVDYCRLTLFKRHSNVFLVLCSKDNKHIITLTSGNCKLGKRKKTKLAVHNMGLIVKRLIGILDVLKIRYIHLFIWQKFSGHFYNLTRLLRNSHIRIINFTYVLKILHGFKKGRKLRRL